MATGRCQHIRVLDHRKFPQIAGRQSSASGLVLPCQAVGEAVHSARLDQVRILVQVFYAVAFLELYRKLEQQFYISPSRIAATGKCKGIDMNYAELNEVIYLKEALVEVLLDDLVKEIQEIIEMRGNLTDLLSDIGHSINFDEVRPLKKKSDELEILVENAQTPAERDALQKEIFLVRLVEEVNHKRIRQNILFHQLNATAKIDNSAMLRRINDVIKYNQARKKYPLFY